MTAINLIVRPDAVHLFTDAAFYRDGVATGFGSKIELWPAAGAAFAVSGQKADAILTGAVLATQAVPATLKELLATFSAAVAEARQQRGAAGPYRAVLGGWSAEAGGFGVHVHGGHGAPPEAQFTNEALVPFAPTMEGWSFRDDQPSESGAALVRLQRHCPEAAGNFVVGGWCQHTRISPAGITTGIVATWPDKIGEAIRP